MSFERSRRVSCREGRQAGLPGLEELMGSILQRRENATITYTMVTKSPGLSAAPGRAAGRASFFLAAHVVLLLIVLTGFAPSFYLRATFPHVHQLPALLHVHGAVLTGWFVLTVVQGWLIGSQRWDLHRRLGYFAAVYAALVIVLGVLANLMLISQLDSPADGENVVVWANFFTLVMFAVFVSLAIVFRTRPDAHKRLILLASMSIIGPALARFPRWPIFAGGLEAGRSYAIGGLLILFALLIAYDVVTRRRPHPASWIGMVAIIASIAGAVFLGVTGIGWHLING